MNSLKLFTIILSTFVLSACGGSSVTPTNPTTPSPEPTASSSKSAVVSSSLVNSIKSSAPTISSSSIAVISSVSSASSKSSSSVIVHNSSVALSSVKSSSSIVSSSKSSSSVAITTDKWVFRGTPNSWGKTAMIQSGNTFTLCQAFSSSDAGGGNGFKISNDSKGDWVEAYPTGSDNYPVEVGSSYDIAFDAITHVITAAKRTSACGGTQTSSSNSVSTSSSSSNTSTSNNTADVKNAAGTLDSRLACYKGAGEKACNLRTYQVMVEAFINGDDSINMNAGYGTSHHKGDLQGIINSLDYIKSLGVNTLWLTPVFETVKNSNQDIWGDMTDATGYFASNYFKVDPRFGSDQKLKELVDTAHAKGLYVLLDGVFGHFKNNASNYKSPMNRNVSGSTASYPKDLDFFKEVAAYWITNFKIDGWRLDQAYQVPVNNWADIRSVVETTSASTTYTNSSNQTVNPVGYMVGEIWKGEAEIKSSGYGAAGSPGLLSAFDFPMRYRLVQTLAVEESGVGKSPATTLNDGYKTQSGYPDHAMPNLMLTNHDLVRFGDLIQRGNIANPTDDQYWLRHKAAISFMAAYSGPITLYYGDEIGQEVANFAAKVDGGSCSSQGKCDDHVSRDSGYVEGITGSLNARQSDLKSYVASLMNLRDAHPALWNGSRTHIYSNTSIYIDRKDAGSDHILYALNTTNAEVRVSIAASAINASGNLVDLLDSSTVYINTDGAYYLVLAPFKGTFLKISN